jgi:hypothetical protein
MRRKSIQNSLVICLLSLTVVHAANLANPSITLPEARVAVGVSYDLGGYTLTNLEIPSLFNRIHGRVEYSPLKYLTIGIDGGAIQVNVDRYVQDGDTVPVFKGNFGYSGGGHLKLSTPAFLKHRLSVIAIAQGTIFKSRNKFSAEYRGKDGTGVVGIQFHIPGFGYITAGPWVYLIMGENRSYNGQKSLYSNTNNIRGWLSVDYFPKMAELSNNKPYISFEFSISPKADYSERIPVQEFSFSISIGSVTKRLYGSQSDVDWSP